MCERFERQFDKRTVLALVDFRRAFDTVWHMGLLHKLLGVGVPICCVRWIRQFLADRRACVRVGESCSTHRIFRAGVPQGAVLSPLLFLLYINDIVEDMPADVEVSLYADDVALWAGGSTIPAASRRVQAALLVLERWAQRWKLAISPEKSEAAAFALGNNAASQASPVLRLGGQRLRCTTTPRLLGVTFDRQLTFRAHVTAIEEKMTARLQQLRRLAGRSWGCRAEDLRTVYLAYIRSVADYCGACYLPAAADSTVRRLDVVQRQAARVITGCVASTPTGALEREAGLMPLRLRGQQLSGCALVRASTKPADEPLRVLINNGAQVQRRLKVGRSWLPRAREAVAGAGVRTSDVRCRPPTLPLPPWEPWPVFDVRLDLAVEPSDGSPEAKRVAAELTLASLPAADVVVWTDGSVAADQTGGGAGVVIELSAARRLVPTPCSGTCGEDWRR